MPPPTHCVVGTGMRRRGLAGNPPPGFDTVAAAGRIGQHHRARICATTANTGGSVKEGRNTNCRLSAASGWQMRAVAGLCRRTLADGLRERHDLIGVARSAHHAVGFDKVNAVAGQRVDMAVIECLAGRVGHVDLHSQPRRTARVRKRCMQSKVQNRSCTLERVARTP